MHDSSFSYHTETCCQTGYCCLLPIACFHLITLFTPQSVMQSPALNSAAALPAFCGPGAEMSSSSIPNFFSNVSLYFCLRIAVGGPPATIFPSFFAMLTIFFHSFCESAATTLSIKRPATRTIAGSVNCRSFHGRLVIFESPYPLYTNNSRSIGVPLAATLIFGVFNNVKGLGKSKRRANASPSYERQLFGVIGRARLKPTPGVDRFPSVTIHSPDSTMERASDPFVLFTQ